jgi:hypothetical protein
VTWNGHEVLVVGGQGPSSNEATPYGDGVAYNPVSNRWRRLPAMDTGRIGHTAVWTGRQLLVWGGRTRTAGSWTAPVHGLAYDRASNRWSPLPRSPLPRSPLPRSPLRGRVGHIAVWTGTQMLVWGGTPARESDLGKPVADGAAYTPYPL